MTTFNRHTIPPGGWIFFNPSTNWHAPNPLNNTFDQQMMNIIKHRLANKATTIKNNLPTDPYTVGNELEAFTRARRGLPANSTASRPKKTPLHRMADGVGAAVEGVKRLAAGAALLFEWDESGQPPVAPELANARAAICSTCPKNEAQHLSKFFTAPVSEMLRKKLQRLHSMNLITPDDQKLGICSACYCPLKLKVFCGLDLILRHARPEDVRELDSKCWILAERDSK